MPRPKKNELPPGCRWRGTKIQLRRMRAGATEYHNFETPAEAWEFVEDTKAVERAAQLGIAAPATASRSYTLAEIIPWYQRTYLAKAKDRGRSGKLDRALADLGARRVDALTPGNVATWIEQLAEQPVVRPTPVEKSPRIVRTASGEPQMRGRSTLAHYLTTLSSALQWHAKDHGYESGFVNPAKEAGAGLRERGIIASSKRRKRRLRPGEETALLEAAADYVDSGEAVIITRKRRRKFDVALALELARLAPVAGSRLTELTPGELTVDPLGRVVAVELVKGAAPVTVPRRLGKVLEARVAKDPIGRLFPVGPSQPSKVLNRICRVCDLPAMLWQALSTWQPDDRQWARVIAEANSEGDAYSGRGRQRLELPMVAFYRFALATGLRAGEIMQLEARDLNLGADPTVHIAHEPERGRTLKTGEAGDRIVPLLPDAVAALELLPATEGPDARLFGVSLQAVQDRHRKLRATIGAHDLNVHDLRHEALSRLGDSGFPVTDLQVFSGHTTVKSLEVYLQGGTVAQMHQRARALLGARAAA